MDGVVKTTRAVAVTQYIGKLMIINAPIPKPGPNDVLVHVRASGLCSTDIHLLSGRQPLGILPRILEHETAGDIVELGSNVGDWQLNGWVTVGMDKTCGVSRFCMSGNTQLCMHKKRLGFEIDGGHCEYIVVPATI